MSEMQTTGPGTHGALLVTVVQHSQEEQLRGLHGSATPPALSKSKDP